MYSDLQRGPGLKIKGSDIPLLPTIVTSSKLGIYVAFSRHYTNKHCFHRVVAQRPHPEEAFLEFLQ